MQKHAGYLLVLLILCAHSESKSMDSICMFIVAGFSWFAGTHYWNEIGKRDYEKLIESIEKVHLTCHMNLNEEINTRNMKQMTAENNC